jgi:transposase
MSDVAHFLGCGRSSVSTWVKLAKQSIQTRAARPHPGRKPRLSQDQLAELEGLLSKGPKAHGWRTELWTAARVAEFIGRHFHIHFHPEHVRKRIKRRLHWTSQKPQRKAKERDEVAIEH